MTMLATALTLIGTVVGQTKAEEPWQFITPDDIVSLNLTADRSTYYVGEPVFLTLTFRNTGPTTLAGYFVATRDLTEVHYRREDDGFVLLKPVRPDRNEDINEWRNVRRIPAALKPGEQMQSDLVLVFDLSAQRHLLHEPGKYEFKVTTRPAPRYPDHVLTSSIVSVDVEAVPPAERDAFNDYSRLKLARVVQAAGHVVETDRNMLRDAVEFAVRHPHSWYSRHIRKALGRVLKVRLAQGHGTDEERSFLAQLGDEEPEQ
jgi:hypothetical protein